MGLPGLSSIHQLSLNVAFCSIDVLFLQQSWTSQISIETASISYCIETHSPSHIDLKFLMGNKWPAGSLESEGQSSMEDSSPRQTKLSQGWANEAAELETQMSSPSRMVNARPAILVLNKLDLLDSNLRQVSFLSIM